LVLPVICRCATLSFAGGGQNDKTVTGEHRASLVVRQMIQKCYAAAGYFPAIFLITNSAAKFRARIRSRL
jgi:hypothetical protein